MSHVFYCSQTTVLLTSVLTSTSPSLRNTEKPVQQWPHKQQDDEWDYTDTDASTNLSDMSAKLNTVKTYLRENLSDNYVTYFIEHEDLPDEAALTEADKLGIERLLANESAVSRNLTFEGLLGKLQKFQSVLLLIRPLNNFTKYTVQTETSNKTTDVLVEAADNSSLSIALILLNETNATQQVNKLLNNLNFTYITRPRTNQTPVQVMVLLTNNKNSTDIVQKPEFLWRKSKQHYILTHYIDTTMYLLISVIGLLGNGMLLFIFVRHRKMRTAANLMIIHLAICDIVNLGINAPLHFYFNYDNGSRESLITCRIVLVTRQFLRCAAALAVIALIIQRFNIIAPAFSKSPSKRRTFTFTILSIITVWVLPFPITLPSMYAPKFYEPICLHDKSDEELNYVTVLNLVVYCLIMPSLMFGFSIRIARRLNKSVKNIPGVIRHQMQQESRIRTARMMMALAVVFVITFFPFYIWVLLARCMLVSTKSPIMIYALHFTKQLLFANGCFNPIAMFVVSSTFRKLLARHVTYLSEQGVYNTRL